jgi:hypothetical protein
MRASPSDLHSLARKYRALAALRRGQSALAKSDARALANEFPGALRELDSLPLDAIDARLADVARAGRGGRAESWILPMLAYHARMRQLLAVKRLLAGERCPDPECASMIAFALGPNCDPALVVRVAAPPAGRLNRLAFELIASELGHAEGDLEGMLFPRVARGHRPSA